MSDADLVHPDHRRLLLLALDVSRKSSGPSWKTDMDAAIEAHADACNWVWAELERQCKKYLEGNEPPPPTRDEIEKDIRKDALAKVREVLRQSLPSLIDAALERKPE
jgi:LmbE family N-acetylglucosaminyl deacetylase